MGKKRTKCMFCSNTELTKEHVWPLWLLEFSKAFGKFASTDTRDATRKVRRSIRTPEVTVNCVCEQCNNGWMSGLEGGVASRLIKAMSMGVPTEMSKSEGKTLATWATKTAMVAENMAHESIRFFLPQHMEHLKSTLSPPPGVGVQIARAALSPYRLLCTVRGAQSVNADGFSGRIHTVRLVIGQLVLHVIGVWIDSQGDANALLASADNYAQLRSLWPWSPQRVRLRWPPPKLLLDAAKVREIAETMQSPFPSP